MCVNLLRDFYTNNPREILTRATGNTLTLVTLPKRVELFKAPKI